MWQRASNGGGGSITPTFETKALAVGSSVSFTMNNGAYWLERGSGSGLEYQSYSTGYVINGVHTNRQTRTQYTTTTWDSTTKTVTIEMKSNGAAATVCIYKVD